MGLKCRIQGFFVEFPLVTVVVSRERSKIMKLFWCTSNLAASNLDPDDDFEESCLVLSETEPRHDPWGRDLEHVEEECDLSMELQGRGAEFRRAEKSLSELLEILEKQDKGEAFKNLLSAVYAVGRVNGYQEGKHERYEAGQNKADEAQTDAVDE